MPKVFNDNTIYEIINLYNSGKNAKEISDKLKISSRSIIKYLKLSNIEIRKRINLVNEDYFSVIDTQEKSYLLGYLFADGCVKYNNLKNREYNVRLKIHEKDIHILEFMKNELACSNDIKKDKNTNCFYLSINSKKIVTDLILLGCTPKKSLTLKFPNINDVYINSFIHGYFDGDGSIYFNDKQIHFKILGTESFLNSISEYLKKYNIVYKVEKYTNSKIFQYRVFSKDSIKIIYKLIYDNTSKIFLNRKKDIFDKILKNNKLHNV